MKTLFFLLFITSVATAQTASNGLFIVPTAYTLPKGTHVVSSYELVYLQYSYSPTSTTHISMSSYFPITSDLIRNSFTFGVKQQVYKTDMLAFAVTATMNPHNDGYVALGLAAIGTPDQSLHLGLGRAGIIGEEAAGTVMLIGGIMKVSKRVSWMAEFISSPEAIDEDFKGLFTLGLRFQSFDGLSIDFGAMRPITTYDLGSFIALPILKGTFQF